MADHTNEDRAYALAAADAGCEVLRSGYGRYVAWFEDRNDQKTRGGGGTPTAALAATGRALGLHDQAKAILEEMAGTGLAMDIHGRVLAAEGYVLVPRDVAEKAVLYQLALHSWMDEGSEGMAVSPSEVLANYVALANALGGKKGES